MKTVSAVLLVLALCACDGSAPLAERAQDPAEAEAEVRAAEDRERLGVLNQDTTALRRLWAEDFTVNSPFNTVSPNAATVLDLVRQGLIRYSAFDRRIEHLRIDGDLAIVMGSETVQSPAGAPLAGQSVQRRFTHVWKRDGADWRLIARHANNIVP